MRRLPRWITRSPVPGLVLSSAMLVTFGCSESGPGVSGDPTKSAPSPESFKGKKPEVPDGTAGKKGGRTKGVDRVKGVAPSGPE